MARPSGLSVPSRHEAREVQVRMVPVLEPRAVRRCPSLTLCTSRPFRYVTSASEVAQYFCHVHMLPERPAMFVVDSLDTLLARRGAELTLPNLLKLLTAVCTGGSFRWTVPAGSPVPPTHVLVSFSSAFCKTPLFREACTVLHRWFPYRVDVQMRMGVSMLHVHSTVHPALALRPTELVRRFAASVGSPKVDARRDRGGGATLRRHHPQHASSPPSAAGRGVYTSPRGHGSGRGRGRGNVASPARTDGGAFATQGRGRGRSPARAGPGAPHTPGRSHGVPPFQPLGVTATAGTMVLDPGAECLRVVLTDKPGAGRTM